MVVPVMYVLFIRVRYVPGRGEILFLCVSLHVSHLNLSDHHHLIRSHLPPKASSTTWYSTVQYGRTVPIVGQNGELSVS